MQDKFLECVRDLFINQIEEIISETKLSSEEEKLNAIDTLVLVNDNINSWISSINGVFHIDEELLTKVAELKSPFVRAAKNEIAVEVAKIIENESINVTSKINDFMNELKRRGVDLDGDNEREVKATTYVSQNYLRSIESSVSESESLFGSSRQHILKREVENTRRSTFDCPPDSCGGSSGCC